MPAASIRNRASAWASADKRHVNSHLVAVKVGVISGTGQRMQLQGAALYQHRLKGLNTQPMQGRSAVQQNRMALDDNFQRVPNLGLRPLHRFSGGLDIAGGAGFHQTLHDKGLEQLQRHFLRQAALVHFQLRAYHDNGTAGIVHALAQQVLAETPLLTLQHIGKGFQRAVVGAGYRAAAAAVVDQGVNRFLKHALFVADDDIRGAQLQQPFQTVVAVDDSAVQDRSGRRWQNGRRPAVP